MEDDSFSQETLQDSSEIKDLFQKYKNNLKIHKLDVAIRNDEWNRGGLIKWNYFSLSSYLVLDNIEAKQDSAKKISEIILDDLDKHLVGSEKFNRMLFNAEMYYNPDNGQHCFPNDKLYCKYRGKPLYFHKIYDESWLDNTYSIEFYLFAISLEYQRDIPIFKKGSIKISYKDKKTSQIKTKFQYIRWTELKY